MKRIKSFMHFAEFVQKNSLSKGDLIYLEAWEEMFFITKTSNDRTYFYIIKSNLLGGITNGIVDHIDH